MNLYLITQDVNTDYDTFDSAVVAASCEDDARLIHPSPYCGRAESGWKWLPPYAEACDASTESRTSCWCSAEEVEVKLIGEATGQKAGSVICASYHAG